MKYIAAMFVLLSVSACKEEHTQTVEERFASAIKICQDLGMEPIIKDPGYWPYVSMCVPKNSTVVIPK